MNQSCRTILQRLYEVAVQKGLRQAVIEPDDVMDILQAPLESTLAPVQFLHAEGYLHAAFVGSGEYMAAALTSKGMKLVMSPSEFNREFQPTPQSITVTGNNNIVGSGNTVTGSFNVHKLAEGSNISPELIQEISETLEKVLEALQRKDEKPLKSFLTDLTVKGGVEAAFVGVKAILAAHGILLGK